MKIKPGLINFQSRNHINDAEFYLSEKWAQLQKACKRRDNYTCQKCGFKARTRWEKRNMHAHHKIHRSRGGADSL